jgi:Cupredoxin-like domain
VIVAMYAMGTTWATRLRTISAAMASGTEAVSQPQYEEILRSRRPYWLAAVGFVGLAAILWLMIFKPTLGFGAVPICPEGSPTEIAVCAFDDQRFVPDRLDAPASEPFAIELDNQDEGVPHNVAVYTDDSAAEAVVVGELITGPATTTVAVPALDAGSYFFRCDVHPVMTGTIEVA